MDAFEALGEHIRAADDAADEAYDALDRLARELSAAWSRAQQIAVARGVEHPAAAPLERAMFEAKAALSALKKLDRCLDPLAAEAHQAVEAA